TPGWWEEIIGPGHPIDTHRYFVICVNSLGSCFGSTGPASIDPVTGQEYRLSFPVLSLEDVARGGYEVLKHLGIERVHATVGPSMGGMTALAFELLFPGRSEGLVLMSTGSRSLPFSIALRSLQREMIRRDPNWKGGNYSRDALPLTGMRMARKLGMITYRSAEEWRLRFGRERAATSSEPTNGDAFGIVFEVESYLEHHANKFTGQFDPNCYLYLSRASDLFDVADHGATVAKGLAKVEARRALIIGVTTDFLFPIHQQRELAEGLGRPGRDVQFVELDSLQGHDSFLVDMDSYRPLVARFFE
ncbi:MAG: homoserine O-acetyltransferase, partial [Gammaproteobacteria bacterium]|nr:homoserine O-acetyltransferase [Gammaproteobacteria bacterium]